MFPVDDIVVAKVFIDNWDEYTYMTAVEAYADIFHVMAMMDLEGLILADFCYVC
jgi:hypothetical protein|tara:strand:+ start:93 stop:254 length:162 start_codon:yes stop_codon:yes gene_type:complete